MIKALIQIAILFSIMYTLRYLLGENYFIVFFCVLYSFVTFGIFSHLYQKIRNLENERAMLEKRLANIEKMHHEESFFGGYEVKHPSPDGLDEMYRDVKKTKKNFESWIPVLNAVVDDKHHWRPKPKSIDEVSLYSKEYHNFNDLVEDSKKIVSKKKQD